MKEEAKSWCGQKTYSITHIHGSVLAHRLSVFKSCECETTNRPNSSGRDNESQRRQAYCLTRVRRAAEGRVQQDCCSMAVLWLPETSTNSISPGS